MPENKSRRSYQGCSQCKAIVFHGFWTTAKFARFGHTADPTHTRLPDWFDLAGSRDEVRSGCIYLGQEPGRSGFGGGERGVMYSAKLIQQLYGSRLFSAAVVETPDGLRIVCTVEMYMSGERHPVLLYRSAIRLMDPEFDGSAERAEKMAAYLNRVSRYPVFAEMVKHGRGVTV